MKYTPKIYEDFGHFFAKALEISKDKIGLYNQLLSPPIRKKVKESGFSAFISFVIHILRVLGWYIYFAMAALVGLGLLGYFGGMASLIATNPVLAAAVAMLGGSGIYLIWEHRVFLMAQKIVGSRYKDEFEHILKNTIPLSKDRIDTIENLMKKCVISLCIEVYQINNDAAHSEIEREWD